MRSHRLGKTALIVAATSACVVGAYGASALASQGFECEPNFSGTNAKRVAGAMGSSTVNTGTSSFLCPIVSRGVPPPAVLSNVYVQAANLNDPNGQVRCIVSGYNKNKTGSWSSAKWLCANFGGCGSQSFPGSNSFGLLQFTSPLGSATYNTTQVECTLTNNGGESRVVLVTTD
jgi:hypothetical protein